MWMPPVFLSSQCGCLYLGKPWPCRAHRTKPGDSQEDVVRVVEAHHQRLQSIFCLPGASDWLLFACEMQRRRLKALISCCGTCTQTVALILLTDSFAAFPFRRGIWSRSSGGSLSSENIYEAGLCLYGTFMLCLKMQNSSSCIHVFLSSTHWPYHTHQITTDAQTKPTSPSAHSDKHWPGHTPSGQRGSTWAMSPWGADIL